MAAQCVVRPAERWCDMKLGALGGIIPQILAKGGKNAGFALGILPGLLYKDQYKDDEEEATGMKKGGKVKKYAKGGTAKSSASKRADGCATKGKTKGKFI
jgi:hypothetical protein